MTPQSYERILEIALLYTNQPTHLTCIIVVHSRKLYMEMVVESLFKLSTHLSCERKFIDTKKYN